MQGALTTLFGRVCSTTELPGLMAEKFEARVYGIFPRRLGFWRVEINVERIACESNSDAVTIALNRWLEALLRRDDNLCASWLWAHDRWRNQDMPSRRFRLEAKRNLLEVERKATGDRRGPALPRRTRIWIRLPNWLGDVVMALPLLRALRASRPDAEITLIAKRPFVPLLASWDIADRVRALPPQGWGYFPYFRKLRDTFPDVWLLFTNSTRGDLEAWFTNTRQRFGIARPGKPRRLLSHTYPLPAGYDEQAHHQLDLWKNFLEHFGLSLPPDRTPIKSPIGERQSASKPIGLICGSENMPEKRWPVAHWRTLITAFPQETFALFGTANDQPITAAVAAGLPNVRDLAGKTDLLAFAENLRSCRALVTNDTGGMHLANALGVPLIVLFGPTNPTRTGPVFDAPTTILRSPTASLNDLAPETVVRALRELLPSAVS
jgi:ADP-heptose:LPS heptosyltransferase